MSKIFTREEIKSVLDLVLEYSSTRNEHAPFVAWLSEAILCPERAKSVFLLPHEKEAFDRAEFVGIVPPAEPDDLPRAMVALFSSAEYEGGAWRPVICEWSMGSLYSVRRDCSPRPTGEAWMHLDSYPLVLGGWSSSAAGGESPASMVARYVEALRGAGIPVAHEALTKQAIPLLGCQLPSWSFLAELLESRLEAEAWKQCALRGE